MSPFAQTMTILCAIGAGTAAGVFFTFSMNHVRTVAAILLTLSLRIG